MNSYNYMLKIYNKKSRPHQAAFFMTIYINYNFRCLLNLNFSSVCIGTVAYTYHVHTC
jgi:hypothetical protein